MKLKLNKKQEWVIGITLIILFYSLLPEILGLIIEGPVGKLVPIGENLWPNPLSPIKLIFVCFTSIILCWLLRKHAKSN